MKKYLLKISSLSHSFSMIESGSDCLFQFKLIANANVQNPLMNLLEGDGVFCCVDDVVKFFFVVKYNENKLYFHKVTEVEKGYKILDPDILDELNEKMIVEISQDLCTNIENAFSVFQKMSIQKNIVNYSALNLILFGAPGTGKSHRIDHDLFKDKNGHSLGIGLKTVPQEQKFRATFHPDYDYAQFIGSYKPTERKSVDPGYLSEEQLTRLYIGFKNTVGSNPVHKFGSLYWKSAQALSGQEKKNVIGQPSSTMDIELNKGIAVGSFLDSLSVGSSIVYSFVPQVFAKAYIAAWKAYLENQSEPKQVYLVIEEINRGNCAQIFGDIFQLLDKKDGHSEYPIDVDSDFADFIRTELNDKFDSYKSEICSYCDDVAQEESVANEEFCKIALPPNFNILATMNTSDQSLFPMDSAFKRRFDWEYVPIHYKQDEDCGNDWNADQFVIKLDDATSYNWLEFLQNVNKDIYETTLSEDKQMGEFFVKPKNNIIDLDMFRSKVLFYLWDSVYKDEIGRDKVFHFKKENSNDKVTFQTLFEGTKKEQISLVKKIFKNLGFKTETNGGAGASPTNDNVGVVTEPENPENTEA